MSERREAEEKEGLEGGEGVIRREINRLAERKRYRKLLKNWGFLQTSYQNILCSIIYYL